MKFRKAACALVIGIVAIRLHADPRHVDPQHYLGHIKYLASDDLEGRGDGMPGLEKAADYIAEHFRASGLEPAGDNGTFFQRFELVAGLSLDSGNGVTLKTPRRTVSLEIGRDYELLSTSSGAPDEPPSLPVVFAGYGISASSMQYDDYANID